MTIIWKLGWYDTFTARHLSQDTDYKQENTQREKIEVRFHSRSYVTNIQ